MKLKGLLTALEEIKAKSPHLLEQDVTCVLDNGVIDLILVNIYGDDRITFMQDFIRDGDSDGRTVDASEED